MLLPLTLRRAPCPPARTEEMVTPLGLVSSGTASVARAPPNMTRYPPATLVTVTDPPTPRIEVRLFRAVCMSVARLGELKLSEPVVEPLKDSVNVPLVAENATN